MNADKGGKSSNKPINFFHPLPALPPLRGKERGIEFQSRKSASICVLFNDLRDPEESAVSIRGVFQGEIPGD